MAKSRQKNANAENLDPLLATLQQALQTAWDNNPDHYLPVNTESIGPNGAEIIALMQSNLAINGYTLTGNIVINPDPVANTLLVSGNTAETIIGISNPDLTATFRVHEQKLIIELDIPAVDPWTFSDSFPAFSQTWLSVINFVSTETSYPVFVLSSIPGSEPGKAIERGLNLQALLVLDPPFSTLIQVVSGALNPLPLCGKVDLNHPATTTLNLLGTVPSFSFELPGINPLSFNNPAFAVSGISTTYNQVDYLQMDCWVMADVTMGSYTLPLAIRLAVGGSLPLLMLQREKSIPLADITGFFTAMFTASASPVLNASLPQFINTLLSKFSLTDFVITLNSDWKGFSTVSFAIASTNAEGTHLWPIIPGVFELQKAGIGLTLTSGPDLSFTTSGNIWGNAAIGQNLMIGTSIPIPVSTGEWVFTASAENAIPNLAQFAQFMGGDKLSTLLPANLANVGGFSLTELTVKFNPIQQKFNSFSIILETNNTWNIIDNWVLVSGLWLEMHVDTPLSNPQLTGSFRGSLIIGTVAVEVDMMRSSPTADWILQVMTSSVILPSLADMTQLLGGTQLVSVLPDSIVQNHFTLQELNISINVSQRKMNLLSFLLESPDTWDIITGLLAVRSPGIYFKFDWSGNSGLVITGYIYGNLIFAEADFYVEANKGTDGWALSATLTETTPLHLFKAIDAIKENASQQLIQLGVPDIVLSTASISYQTGSGDYELEGLVNINDPVTNRPWSFNVGQTGISIQDIGLKVSAKKGPDKQPTGTKVFLKGTLKIGASITFKINYEVGGDLVIKGTLVEAGQYLSVKDLISNLCDPAAGSVTWTSSFESLDQIRFSNVQLNFVIGNNPSFQVYGTMLVGGVAVNAVFVLSRQTTWNFAIGIKVSMSPGWSIPGFTTTLSTFQLDQATFALVASSFDNAYSLPPEAGIPEVSAVAKGLNFYAAFQISETDNRFKATKAVLPEGMLPIATTLVVQGLITDPLSNSYIEVVLNSVAAGVPLMGWNGVRLKKFSLRLYAEPAIALHGEFIMNMITDEQGNSLIIAIDLKASVSEIAIVFIPQIPFKDRKIIIAWKDALGIIGLTIYLTDLELGIKPFAGPALTGTIGGGIDFSSSAEVLSYPDPVVVKMLKKRSASRLMKANGTATFCDMTPAINLKQPINTNVRLEAKVGFMIVPESPEPVIPNKVGLRMVNFTLPYILDRFVHITLPEVLFPVLFPDICFYASFDPTKPSKVLDFEFNGQIVIFGFHGHIAAMCNQTRIYLNAGMDPVIFSVDGKNLLVIQRSANNAAEGPYVIIDSAPTVPSDPNLSASLYCNFFGAIKLEATALVKVDAINIMDSYFYFDMHGNAGQLASMQMHLEYQKAKYLNISGSFALFLDTAHIPGFSINNSNNNQTVKAADQISLKNMPGSGVDLAAAFEMILDNRGATPNFSLNGSGSFRVHVNPCDIQLQLQFNVTHVTADTIGQLPVIIATQMAANAANIFSALYQTAECFAQLVKLGVIIFNDAADAAKVMAKYFVIGIDLASKLLSGLGNGVEEVAEWLWDIFDSKDSEKNTKALKDNTDYNDHDISKAVKTTAGPAYTAEILIRDQAYAGYSAISAAQALVYNFSQYQNDPVNTGKLLKARYSYLQITSALRAVFNLQTTTPEAMYSILQQVFTSSLTAQQMANALALIYPAKDVATSLKTHYPAETDTAAKMAALLLSAYQQATHPLLVNDLAGALAPLYPAAAVAKVLKDNFPDQTGTPGAMADILDTAYTASGSSLDASKMTVALANAPFVANSVAPVIHTKYPNNTQTALEMAQLLLAAYPALQTSAADMIIALAAVPYPASGIATALQTLYAQEVLHAAQMAALFAHANILPKDASPVLKQLYHSELDTPEKMISVLLTAYSATPIGFADMAIALAVAPYDVLLAAPALHTQYPQQTQTATVMLVALQAAYVSPSITFTIMAQALKACRYEILQIAEAIKAHFAADVPHALQMAQLLALAPPFPAVAVAPVLQTLYHADTATAPLLAAVLAQAPYQPVEVAVVVKQLFPLTVPKATDMFALLSTAYQPAAIDATQMASALAHAPYEAPEVSPVLKSNYSVATATPAMMAALLNTAYSAPLNTENMTTALARAPYPVKDVALFLKSQGSYAPDVNTAAKMSLILFNAYQPAISSSELLIALASVNFNAYESTSPVRLHFNTVTAANLALELVSTYQSTAPLSSLTLGLALSTATVPQNDLVLAVHGALPSTTAGEMAALLVIAFSPSTNLALSTAESNKILGNDILVTSPKVTQAVPAVTAPELAGALISIFSPPNTLVADLSKALCKGYVTPSPNDIASGLMSAFSTLDAIGLSNALTTGFNGIGQALTTTQLAAAIIAGFNFIGKVISESALAQWLIIYSPGITPVQLAADVVTAFGADHTSIQKILDVLYSTFGTLTPFQASTALQPAFGIPANKAVTLAQPIVQKFALTELPNHVGCIGLAMRGAQFPLTSVSGALGVIYSPNWNAADFAVLSSVYNGAVWNNLLQLVKDNKTSIQAAQALKLSYPAIAAGEMCALLAAGFYLVHVNTSVVPMATAMKAAGYSLIQTSGAMGLQYAPNWTAANYAEVVQIYKS